MADSSNTRNGLAGAPKWAVGTLTYSTIGLVMVFAWLLWGDLAWTMKGRTIGAITTLMVNGYGISDFWYAILMVSIPNFTNIFLIPWISYKSDRHRGKWGRRIPYILWTTPIVVIALAGIGLSSQIGDWLYPILYEIKLDPAKCHLGEWFCNGWNTMTINNVRLGVFTVFWLLLDQGTTLSCNIYGALANDVIPKAVMGRYQAIARTFSLGIAVLFNYGFMDKAKSHATILMLSIAAFYGIGLISMCLMVKEGDYPPVEKEPEGKKGNLLVNLFMNTVKMLLNFIRQCFAIPYYCWLFAAIVFMSLAGLPYNTYLMFFSESLNVDLGVFGKAQSASFFIAFLMTYGLGVLSDKFHPIRTSLASLFFLLAINLFGGMFCRTPKIFIFMLIAHGIGFMSYNTLSLSLTPRLFPQSLFAQFSSALALITSAGTVLLTPVLGKIIERSGHKYYLIYYMEAVFEVLAIFSFIMVYYGFKKYGGDKDYKAPEPAKDL